MVSYANRGKNTFVKLDTLKHFKEVLKHFSVRHTSLGMIVTWYIPGCTRAVLIINVAQQGLI